jgi:hypothetical protein
MALDDPTLGQARTWRFSIATERRIAEALDKLAHSPRYKLRRLGVHRFTRADVVRIAVEIGLEVLLGVDE